jgi:hypothetical protein
VVDPSQDLETSEPTVRTARSVAVGVVLTVLVLVLVSMYLSLRSGRPLMPGEAAPGSTWELLLRVSMGDVGQFVSGTAALLALLWIFLAYLRQSTQLRLQCEELVLQRYELALQRQEMKRLADQAHQQVEVLRQTSRVARREAFMPLLDLYERKLVQEASQISSITATDPVASENHKQAWIDYERGDRNALFRNLIRQLIRGQHTEFLRRVDGFAGGRAYLELFSSTAAEVLKEAAQVDQKMQTLCRASEWASLAELLDKVRANAPRSITHSIN